MRRFLSTLGIGISILGFAAPAMARGNATMPDSGLMIRAQQDLGHYTIHILGHGPASSLVRLHVQTWISRDLPAVGLGDNNGYKTVTTDAAGNFSTYVPYAGLSWDNALVTVDGVIPDTTMHASTDFHLDVPSNNVHTRTDTVRDR